MYEENTSEVGIDFSFYLNHLIAYLHISWLFELL